MISVLGNIKNNQSINKEVNLQSPVVAAVSKVQKHFSSSVYIDSGHISHAPNPRSGFKLNLIHKSQVS